MNALPVTSSLLIFRRSFFVDSSLAVRIHLVSFWVLFKIINRLFIFEIKSWPFQLFIELLAILIASPWSKVGLLATQSDGYVLAPESSFKPLKVLCRFEDFLDR